MLHYQFVNEFFFSKRLTGDRQFIDGSWIAGSTYEESIGEEVELENEYNKMIDEFKDFSTQTDSKPGDGKTTSNDGLLLLYSILSIEYASIIKNTKIRTTQDEIPHCFHVMPHSMRQFLAFGCELLMYSKVPVSVCNQFQMFTSIEYFGNILYMTFFTSSNCASTRSILSFLASLKNSHCLSGFVKNRAASETSSPIYPHLRT